MVSEDMRLMAIQSCHLICPAWTMRGRKDLVKEAGLEQFVVAGL
jgi:hypothetical protein